MTCAQQGTMTTIKEEEFGRFQTLKSEVKDWLKENKATQRVIRARYTVVPTTRKVCGKQVRNEFHRAANIIHQARS